MAPTHDREKALDLALAQIDKNFGKGSVMRLGQEARQPLEVIPTGSIALDIALGIGGLPRGRVVEIYGPESSGKTTVALHRLLALREKHLAESTRRFRGAVLVPTELLRRDEIKASDLSEIIGVEAKVSRTTFLTGLKDGQFLRYQERLSGLFVVTPPMCVSPGELPNGIGQLEVALRPGDMADIVPTTRCVRKAVLSSTGCSPDLLTAVVDRLAAGQKVWLVGHSLGAALVPHLVEAKNIAGALLVAPPELSRGDLPTFIREFEREPVALPFPATVIASSDDPYASLEASERFAKGLGARFENVGAKGHLNAESKLGTWPEGWELLRRLRAQAPFVMDPRLAADAVQQEVAKVEQELGGRGRVLLRKSGTEPLIRVMVEGAERPLVEGLAEELASVVTEALA